VIRYVGRQHRQTANQCGMDLSRFLLCVLMAMEMSGFPTELNAGESCCTTGKGTYFRVETPTGLGTDTQRGYGVGYRAIVAEQPRRGAFVGTLSDMFPTDVKKTSPPVFSLIGCCWGRLIRYHRRLVGS